MKLDHQVTEGTRDPERTLARTDPDNLGNPPFPVWASQHSDVSIATLAEAAADAELIVNATNGAGSLEALEVAREENLAGKIFVDIANPLDFSHGMPPSLFAPTLTPWVSRSSAAFRTPGW